MDDNNIPPVLAPAGDAAALPPETSTSVARWRWWVHLIVLGMFPLLPLLFSLLPKQKGEAKLPTEVNGLLLVLGIELALFGVFFVIAWVASRVNSAQLMLTWRGGGMPVVWGLVYSIGIRVVLFVIALIAYFAWVLIQSMATGHTEKISMPTEGLVDSSALTHGSLYLLISMTLLSFVLGGFREELWRSAMFAGVKALFPRQFEKLSGKIIAVLIIAVLFGLGHVSQHWTGMVLIGLLGAVLGWIMLRHRSIWEAVLAHGFFDASTFAMLYLIAKYAPQILKHQ